MSHSCTCWSILIALLFVLYRLMADCHSGSVVDSSTSSGHDQSLQPKPFARNSNGRSFLSPLFGFCNSGINPVLYAIFSGNYRPEFYRILCKGARWEDSNKAPVLSRGTRRQTGHRVQEEASRNW